MSRDRLHATVTLSEHERRYLDSSARVRGISSPELVRRVLQTVMSDQMILGIMDDDSRREPKSSRWATPRPDALFIGLPHNYATHVERARDQK